MKYFSKRVPEAALRQFTAVRMVAGRSSETNTFSAAVHQGSQG